MGIEVNLQAIPEKHELVKWAHKDRHIADKLPRLNGIIIKRGYSIPPHLATDDIQNYDKMVLALAKDYPKVLDLTYNGDKKHDVIHYLISAKRRAGHYSKSDDSLISTALYGEIQLNPEIRYVGFVKPATVHKIVDNLQGLILEQFTTHLNYDDMEQVGVYKSGPYMNVDHLWAEFCAIRDVYVGASQSDFAVITDLS